MLYIISSTHNTVLFGQVPPKPYQNHHLDTKSLLMDGSGLIKPGSGSANKPGAIRNRIRNTVRKTATLLVCRFLTVVVYRRPTRRGPSSTCWTSSATTTPRGWGRRRPRSSLRWSWTSWWDPRSGSASPSSCPPSLWTPWSRVQRLQSLCWTLRYKNFIDQKEGEGACVESSYEVIVTVFDSFRSRTVAEKNQVHKLSAK